MGAVQHEIGSRARIVSAARTLFASQGFHSTAVSELATAADVSVGQIYRLFSGKNEVIAAIVREDAEAKLADTAALSARVKAGTLSVKDAFVELTLRVMSGNDDALSFEILAEAHRNPCVSATIADLCTSSRSVIRDLACVANPELLADDLDGAEELILGLMFGLSHRTLSCPRLSPQETAEQAAHMILAALKARTPA